jgi:hypothetical protein
MSLMGGRVLEKNKVNLMNLAVRCKATAKRTGNRCQSPAVTGFAVCRMHGARGGAPSGERNGNYRHGGSTKKTIAVMAEMRALMRSCRETIDVL